MCIYFGFESVCFCWVGVLFILGDMGFFEGRVMFFFKIWGFLRVMFVSFCNFGCFFRLELCFFYLGFFVSD